ncbi:MAG: hypothetical protein AAGA56_02595 [Myxococcota bacterium]
MLKTRNALGALALILSGTACGDETATKGSPAPSATTLEDTKPKAATAMTFEVRRTGSKVGFHMEAPVEKIRGKVEDAASGQIEVDITDLTKTTGHLYLDIGGLEIFQRKAGDDGSFGDEIKEEKQNKHARNWLEIGSCDNEKVEDKSACEASVKKNRNVEFVITRVTSETSNITKLKGDERKVMATVEGDFLLHQKKTRKTAKLSITFKMQDDEPVGLHVETEEPFLVGLEEHEVQPRQAFGVLAKATLGALNQKVGKEAAVTVSFDATRGPAKE